MKPRASLFGGSYWNDDNAGSRRANVDNWPDNSNENYGARGRCDDRFTPWHRAPAQADRAMPVALRRSRSRRPITKDSGPRVRIGGQPVRPASANTLRGPVERGVARRVRVETRGRLFALLRQLSASVCSMSQRYRNLIGIITSDEVMLDAYRLTSRGHRLAPARLAFKEFDVLHLAQLAAELRDGSYRQGASTVFRIYDPKPRTISALPFRDRVAQQALCRVIGPLLDRALLPRAFACRPGKGTHAGVRALQSDLRRLERIAPVYALKTDFSAYFASIQRPVLWRLLEAKFSCAATLRIVEAMVPREGIGLPIGALTSQIFANYYTGATLDRLLQQEIGESYWYRYMDDLVVLGHSLDHLRLVKAGIEAFSAERLGLRFSKWSIAPAKRGINFLGYRIWSSHKLLRQSSTARARQEAAIYAAHGDTERLSKFLASWRGHAGHADAHNFTAWLDRRIAEAQPGGST